MTSKKIQLANKEKAEGKNISEKEINEIISLYEGKLEIPVIKNNPQLVLCPVGLVGAGKTTVTKSISRKLNLLQISTDEIRKILKEKGFNYIKTLKIAIFLIDKYSKKGYSICIDADCVSPDTKDYIKNLNKEVKLIDIWIHIKPPEEFIINKLKNYKHTWLFKDSTEAIDNYKRRKPLHKEFASKIDYFYKFDTSKKEILNKEINKFVLMIKKKNNTN